MRSVENVAVSEARRKRGKKLKELYFAWNHDLTWVTSLGCAPPPPPSKAGKCPTVHRTKVRGSARPLRQ